jgi:Fe-Mn family superoxide dismutase
MFVLPKLTYDFNALEPVISERTMRLHHDKHHRAYVKATNEILAKAGRSFATLEGVIAEAHKKGDAKLFNNAAQAWNHAFFWKSMSPAHETPSGELKEAIDTGFGGLDELKAAFVTEGVGQFGSGWVWLAADSAGGLKVQATHDAANTLDRMSLTPLLVCDVWEHAYYLDHQNERKAYLTAWFEALPHWTFAAAQYAARGHGGAWRYAEAEASGVPA